MRRLWICCLSLSLLLLYQPIVPARAAGADAPPPVSQQLVREGDLALKLANALAVGEADEEVEAENLLAEVGIAPSNGWIADYPVTPDVLGEIYKTVRDAAVGDKLSMGVEDALARLKSVTSELGLAVTPSSAYTPKPGSYPPGGSPDQTVIDDYYATQEPPVVTYYTPPPDYYYMYSWVPYPFWWFGFWYPGYFILNDFHRVVHHQHRSFYISNHFRDLRYHRVYRIDPLHRLDGRTYAGIGAHRSRTFISTGVPRSEHRIFNTPRTRTAPTVRGQELRGTVERGTVVRGTEIAPRRGTGSGDGWRGGNRGGSGWGTDGWRDSGGRGGVGGGRGGGGLGGGGRGGGGRR